MYNFQRCNFPFFPLRHALLIHDVPMTATPMAIEVYLGRACAFILGDQVIAVFIKRKDVEAGKYIMGQLPLQSSVSQHCINFTIINLFQRKSKLFSKVFITKWSLKTSNFAIKSH